MKSQEAYMPIRIPGGLLLWAVLGGSLSFRPARGQEAAPDPEIARLVEQLDSEDLALRDQARSRLLARGWKSAPALRPFLKSPSAEVASQVQSILGRFEWEENLERSLPSRYRMTTPKASRSLSEIFGLIERELGYRIVPCAVRLRQTIDRGWENASVLSVLDDVCRSLGRGRVELPPLQGWGLDRPDLIDPHRRPTGQVPEIVIDGEKSMPLATAYGGPLRAAVTDVILTEIRSLRETVTQGEIKLQLSAVPGTRPAEIGSWQIEEIVDDQGQSLKSEPANRLNFGQDEIPEAGESPDGVWFPGGQWSSMEEPFDSIPFAAPGAAARRLARVRLKIRLSFPVKEVTRQMTLAQLKEKGSFDFGIGGLEITQVDQKDGVFNLGYRRKGVTRGSPNFVLLNQEGRELRTVGGGMTTSGIHIDQKWFVQGLFPVASVRITAWVGSKTVEIPVEFQDLPLPVEK
jgi:hypothetical protein